MNNKNCNRKWFYNHSAFQNKTPEFAYWMGFLMADGCITISGKYNRRRLYLNLAEEDKEHLYKFCNFLGLPKDCINIKVKQKTQNIYSLNIDVREDEVTVLARYGIVPRKTYNFIEPQISTNLLSHFLRGWLDGDGYIKKTYPEVMRITGNKQAIKWYADAIKLIGYNRNISFYANDKDVWGKIQIGGRINIANLTDILQAKNNIKLERKWKEALEWNNLVENGLIRKQVGV